MLQRTFQDIEETGEVLVELIRSSKANNELRLARDKHQTMYEQHLESRKTSAQNLNEVVQCEERAGQRLLDQEAQKSQSERQLEKLEEEFRHCSARSQNMDSELQFLQGELESLRSSEQELQALQQEVDEDTTEVIPSAIYLAQLYHKVTRIKWEHDAQTHILRGVHYGAELATPVYMDTSVRSPCSVSDELWGFVSAEW